MKRLVLGLVVFMCLGVPQGFPQPIVGLSIQDGPGYTQSITVDPGEEVVLAYRIQDVADLAGWSVVLDKRFEGDPVCEFIAVADGLPGWSMAGSGHTRPPDCLYLADSYAMVGQDFTGSGDMAYIRIVPLKERDLTGTGIELADGMAQWIDDYELGDMTVQITVTGQALEGDVDGNGCVNVSDLVAVRVNLGQTGSGIDPPEADVDGDGICNVSDLVRVRVNQGLGCE